MKTENIKSIASAYMQVLEDKTNEEKKPIDKVQPSELQGTHAQRKDKDINNDGKVDSSDEYLHNRRKAVSKAMQKEEAELDEAVEVSHDRYMRSHGKKASGGHGLWMFTHKRMGDANVNDPKEVHSAQGKFSDAAKSAKAWAKKHGHSTAYVMEDVEQIDEVKKGDYVTHYKTGAVGLVTNVSGDKEIADVKWNKTGRQTSHPRKYLQKMKEEVEQIDELSKKTLGSYVKKATRDVAQRSASNARDYAKSGAKPGMNQKALKNWKREIGIDKAVDRITREEVELDEISKKTLGSYIKKAASDIGNAAETGDTNKELKRHKGIAKAANKLTKEEVENDDVRWPVLARIMERAAHGNMDNGSPRGEGLAPSAKAQLATATESEIDGNKAAADTAKAATANVKVGPKRRGDNTDGDKTMPENK